MITKIFRSDYPTEINQLLLAKALLPHLKWRHHGIGCLQAYVHEGTGDELRIHVWSPKLVKSGIDESGDCHDHRFDLMSHVLCGQIFQEEIEPIADDWGPYKMSELIHARAVADANYDGPMKELPGTYAIRSVTEVVNEGSTYTYPAGHFHRSHVHVGTTVTLVEKKNQTLKPARLLYPKDKPPVHAFGHEMDEGLVKEVVGEAIEAMAKRLGLFPAI